MTTGAPNALGLHQAALVWDAHSCLPLSPDADLKALLRHRAAGVDFVSVNVGMDMNPLPQVLATLASFRAQARANADRFRLVERNSQEQRPVFAGLFEKSNPH